MRHLCLIAVITASLVQSSLHAGQFNEKLSIGDVAPSWEKLPGTDGKPHSLNDFKDKDAVVIVFSCVSCPIAVGYEERIENLVKKYAGPNGKVGLVAICASRSPADRLEKLTERAEKQHFTFPFLLDESQKIAVDFGAAYTPEFYVLNKDRKIAYMGAMDDATDDAAKVTKRYVEDAIDATLKGELPAVKEVRAQGCRIRIVRERK